MKTKFSIFVLVISALTLANAQPVPVAGSEHPSQSGSKALQDKNVVEQATPELPNPDKPSELHPRNKERKNGTNSHPNLPNGNTNDFNRRTNEFNPHTNGFNHKTNNFDTNPNRPLPPTDK